MMLSTVRANLLAGCAWSNSSVSGIGARRRRSRSMSGFIHNIRNGDLSISSLGRAGECRAVRPNMADGNGPARRGLHWLDGAAEERRAEDAPRHGLHVRLWNESGAMPRGRSALFV